MKFQIGDRVTLNDWGNTSNVYGTVVAPPKDSVLSGNKDNILWVKRDGGKAFWAPIYHWVNKMEMKHAPNVSNPHPDALFAWANLLQILAKGAFTVKPGPVKFNSVDLEIIRHLFYECIRDMGDSQPIGMDFLRTAAKVTTAYDSSNKAVVWDSGRTTVGEIRKVLDHVV